MSSGRRVYATVFAAAACLVSAPFVPASANDDEDPHAMLFSGRDIWLNGAFAHGGFLFAPSGLDQDGLLLKILIGLRMAFELWYEPSPNSMVAADASLSSIATSNSARIAYGWRVLCSKRCWEAFISAGD
jgi:Cellulose biosynthesis protein BcsS